MTKALYGRVGGKARLCLRLSGASIEAYEGAVRSSKTITSIYDFLRFLRSGPAGDFAIVGRTERTAVRNILEPIRAMLGRSRVVYNQGTGVVRILGRTGYLYGANNEQARTKIQGMTLAALYLDEAAVVPESFFNMAYSRLSVPGARMWLTANPEGRNHWLLTNWLMKARIWVDADGQVHENPGSPIDLHRYTFVLDDNPHLSREFVARLKASYTGVWYLRFIRSQWTNAEGAVYDAWDPDLHLVKWATVPAMTRLYGVGVDYGTTNATAALVLGHGTDGRLYLLDEWRHDVAAGEARWTDAQLSTGLRTWLPAKHTPADTEPAVEWVYVDPAAASFKTQLYYDGLTNIANADNDVLAGIRTVASLMATDKLRVTDRCKGFVAEVPGYVWDPKATAKGEDKPIKDADHSLDGGRYVVQSTATLWRPALGVAA